MRIGNLLGPALKTTLVVIFGVGLGFSLFRQSDRLIEMGDWALTEKPLCGDPSFIELWRGSNALQVAEARYWGSVRFLQQDPGFRIAQYEVRGDRYWVPIEGEDMGGDRLLYYLLVEQEWMEKLNPREQVRVGDVVIDCGAHIGVFSKRALRRGASKVVAIEPSPLTLECLRRNLHDDIATGRVVVVPKGAWDSPGIMNLRTSKRNSGNNSLVFLEDRRGETAIEVATIDSIVETVGLQKLDYLKMDIEGAERKALAGARTTLAKYRPALAIELYHLIDDPTVLCLASTIPPCQRQLFLPIGDNYRLWFATLTPYTGAGRSRG